ncbi:MAG: threonine--tRNA ligase, partial [Gammaproteobacteria bacterium]|nr:threonine--tRNA ligase [Gammaproteobacteria bacterium]
AWLSPTQVMIMGITDKHAKYVKKVENILKNSGLRVKADLRNEKIGFKIREHTLQKIPYLLVAGDREAENQTVAVRTRAGEELGVMSIDDFMTKLSEEVASRGRISLQK